MNTADWLICADPQETLDFLKHTASERKLRLLACCCCRAVMSCFPDPCGVCGVEVAERFADGAVTEEDLTAASTLVEVALYEKSQDRERAAHDYQAEAGSWCPCCDHDAALRSEEINPGSDAEFGYRAFERLITARSAEIVGQAICHALAARTEWRQAIARACEAGDASAGPLKERLTGLIFEIFGNPYCLVTADRSWLTGTAVALAQTINTERAFDRLPILADALEEAGCDNADILNHCRQPGEHVRGCWVVDLVLGKS